MIQNINFQFVRLLKKSINSNGELLETLLIKIFRKDFITINNNNLERVLL